MIRRNFVTSFLSGAAATVVAHAASDKSLKNSPTVSDRNIPDILVTNQEGKEFHFYSDLVKDKIVMINFMYAQCEGICPTMTSTLVKVQRALGDRVGKDVFMYSVTLKPEQDDPKAFRHYIQMHGVGKGWNFLRASRADTDLLRRKLGFVDSDPKIEADINQHTGMVRIGNDAINRWMACPASVPSDSIVRRVLWVDPANDTRRV